MFATTLLGVVAVGTASSASASGLSWSETSSPTTSFIPPLSSNTPGLEQSGNDLADVSCTSRHFCVAVGTENNSAGGPSLAEEWDGRRWIVSPRSSVAGTSALIAVSCTSPHFCAAAGNTGAPGSRQPFIEIFNGVGWTYTLLNPYPTRTLSEFRDISCTSPVACVAVGVTFDGSRFQTLIESWNGVAWSLVPSPNSGALNNAFAGVSCRGPKFCVAVGAFATASDTEPLIEKWNGSTWTLGVGASLPPGTFGQFAGVSCASTTFCMATGSVDQAALAETWNGTVWVSRPVPPAQAGFAQQFTGVACTSAHRCVSALDRSGPTPASVGGTAEEWNGSGWAAGSGAPGSSGTLHGVSCANQHFCFVVGGSHYFQEGSVAIRGA